MTDYRFHHLHLICTDLDEMEGFFTGVLGAQLIERKFFRDVEGSIVDLAGTQVYLRRAREGEEIKSGPPDKRFGYDHFGLVVDDIDAAYEELTARGYNFTLPPTGQAGKIAFFIGPDNVAIELFQPPK
jgi:catechol 2,3-dioxygenase-like lactoylglutathione lyase family enzyme